MTTTDNQFEEIIEVGKANRQALLMLLPITALAVVPFVIINGFEPLVNGIIFLKHHQLYILVAFLVLILIHEGLHGVTWAFLPKTGLNPLALALSGRT